jgi:hypothetical protein
MSLRRLRNVGVATLFFIGGLSLSEKLSFTEAFMPRAEAYIGLSQSYEGVARRTTRRAIAEDAAAYLLYEYWSPYYRRPNLPYGVYWSPYYGRPVCYHPYPPCH